MANILLSFLFLFPFTVHRSIINTFYSVFVYIPSVQMKSVRAVVYFRDNCIDSRTEAAMELELLKYVKNTGNFRFSFTCYRLLLSKRSLNQIYSLKINDENIQFQHCFFWKVSAKQGGISVGQLQVLLFWYSIKRFCPFSSCFYR